jgi:hypothetical protein
VNLSGYYLTDNIENPNKFPLPAFTLNAGDFVLIWLDDDTDQGSLHSNFKMSSNNNQLWLMRTQTNELRIQDGFAPCISSVDHTMERSIDGGGVIQFTDTPTPGYSNILGRSIGQFQNIKELNISMLANGRYYIRLTSGEVLKFEKS